MSVEKFLKEACDAQGLIRSSAVDVIERMTEEELVMFGVELKVFQQTRVQLFNDGELYFEKKIREEREKL